MSPYSGISFDSPTKVNKWQHCKNSLKSKREKYLQDVEKILYDLLEIVQEEFPMFQLLRSQRNFDFEKYNKEMKIIAPFQLQLNILMRLPFLHDEIEVENADAGFVKLKLPTNWEEMMVDTEELKKKSLLRNVSSWKDENNYLQQTKVFDWFDDIMRMGVELYLSSSDLNHCFKVQYCRKNRKATLVLEDRNNHFEFEVVLLPVFAFKVSQLPHPLIGEVPQNPSCKWWMAECRSNGVEKNQFWGISLWQHEKLIAKSDKQKHLIYILKSLRDGCSWKNLTNYHIRTLVMLACREEPNIFENLTVLEVLVHLLTKLRDMLCDRKGIPFFWDGRHNLLCGLLGTEKSALARSVDEARQRFAAPGLKLEDMDNLLRLETYQSNSTSGSDLMHHPHHVPHVEPTEERIVLDTYGIPRNHLQPEPEVQPQGTSHSTDTMHHVPHVEPTEERIIILDASGIPRNHLQPESEVQPQGTSHSTDTMHHVPHVEPTEERIIILDASGVPRNHLQPESEVQPQGTSHSSDTMQERLSNNSQRNNMVAGIAAGVAAIVGAGLIYLRHKNNS